MQKMKITKDGEISEEKKRKVAKKQNTEAGKTNSAFWFVRL